MKRLFKNIRCRKFLIFVTVALGTGIILITNFFFGWIHHSTSQSILQESSDQWVDVHWAGEQYFYFPSTLIIYKSLTNDDVFHKERANWDGEQPITIRILSSDRSKILVNETSIDAGKSISLKGLSRWKKYVLQVRNMIGDGELTLT